MSQARILTSREYRKVLVYISSRRHASRNKAMLYMPSVTKRFEASNLPTHDD